MRNPRHLPGETALVNGTVRESMFAHYAAGQHRMYPCVVLACNKATCCGIVQSLLRARECRCVKPARKTALYKFYRRLLRNGARALPRTDKRPKKQALSRSRQTYFRKSMMSMTGVYLECLASVTPVLFLCRYINGLDKPPQCVNCLLRGRIAQSADEMDVIWPKYVRAHIRTPSRSLSPCTDNFECKL